MMKKNVRNQIEKKIARWAAKSANLEANTACACLGYQPEEPQNVKKLRKF